MHEELGCTRVTELSFGKPELVVPEAALRLTTSHGTSQGDGHGEQQQRLEVLRAQSFSLIAFSNFES